MLYGELVDELVEEARGDEEIVGVLLTGSLARGDALPGTDIDLRYVLADGVERDGPDLPDAGRGQGEDRVLAGLLPGQDRRRLQGRRLGSLIVTHATEIVLLGYNPGVQLVDDEGRPTAFVSVWGVDWSLHGHGRAIVAVYEGRVRVLGPDPNLGRWLAGYFVRHFPDLEGLEWSEPALEEADVHVELDLAEGVHARAGDLEVTIGDVLDRRAVSIDAFPLGDDKPPHALTMALAPCASAEITIAGRRINGHPKLGGTPARPSSTAYISHSETWRRPV